MRGRKPAADFQLLADHDRTARASDFQPEDPSGRPPRQRLEVLQGAEIDAGPGPENPLQLLPAVGDPPAVEVQGLQVKGRQDPLQKVLIGGVAESVGTGAKPLGRVLFRGDRRTRPVSVSHAGKVGEGCIFPGGCVNIRPSAAAFVVARVADLAPAGEKHAPRGPDGPGNIFRSDARNALIPLAVVVGAHIEAFVVVDVLPDGDFILSVWGRKPVCFLPVQHRDQPAARCDGLRLEKLQGGAGRHFRRDHRSEVFFQRDNIDEVKGSRALSRQKKRAPKRLFLNALPVKIDADGYVGDGKKRFGGHCGGKQKVFALENFSAVGVGQNDQTIGHTGCVLSVNAASVGKNKSAFQDQPGFGSVLQQGRLYVRFAIDHSFIPAEKLSAFLETMGGEVKKVVAACALVLRENSFCLGPAG